MIKPQKYLNRAIFFLIGVIILCAFLFPTIEAAFIANPALNGVIATVLLIGIIISMRQTFTLIPCLNWLENFKETAGSEKKEADLEPINPDTKPDKKNEAPALLASMATMMEEHKSSRMSLSALSMRTILDGIAARMDEGREITRYIIGLLIFLGLLGTFWGLLGTIGSIGSTIDSLSVGTNDLSLMFEDLKEGLAAPLAGMGTAFSSSLFGLAGSVILGFIDLQTGQAQSRFFNHLEDWLSGITKLSSGGNIAIEGGDASVPAYVSALLEESADNLDNVHKVIARSEENRMQVNQAITDLSVQLAGLADHQTEMRNIMKQLVNVMSAQGGNNDGGVSEKHLRNIDVQLKSLTEETIKGQDRFADSLHTEIRILARTLSAVAEGNPAPSSARSTAMPSRKTQPSAPTPTPAKEEIKKPEIIDEGNYAMPEPKPRTNKKPALTAKRDD